MAARRGKRFIPVTKLEAGVLFELWQSFGVAVVALTLLMVVRMASEAVWEGLPLGTLVKFVPLMLPYTLPWTIPTAFMAACIMVYSRMSAQNEVMVVRASGIHLWRILSPAAMTALALCALCGLLNHRWVPRTRFSRYGVVKNVSASEHVAAIRALNEPVVRVGKYSVYVRDIDDETFRDIVFVTTEDNVGTAAKEQAGRQVTYIRAPKGSYKYSDERNQIVFELEADPALSTPERPRRGKAMMCKCVYGTTPRDFERAYFDSCTFPIKLGPGRELELLPYKPKHLTTSEVMLKVRTRRRSIREHRLTQQDTAPMSPSERAHAKQKQLNRAAELRGWETEIQKRSALSLAPLLLGLIAVPVGLMIRRGRKIVAFGIAVAIVLCYYALMAGAWKMGESGMLAPPVALWSASAVVGGVGFVLTRNMLRR